MIFKTFDNDIDKISAKWGILGKSFNDIGTAIVGRISDINKGFQATDDLISSIKNSDSVWKRLYPNKETIQSQIINVETLFPKQTDEYFSSLLDDLSQQQNLINKTKGSWQDYFKNLGEGEKWQIEFVQNTDLQKASLNDIKKAYNSARAAQIAQNEALQQSTFFAKAATVATKALAAAGNMIVFTLISNGIELAVSAINDYIHRADKCKERVNEMISTFGSAIDTANSHKNTIEEIGSRYENLAKGVNNLGENVSLTTDEYAEYNDIVNQIADMFPAMVQGYTSEGNAILKLKGNIDSLTEAYEAEQQAAYNALIASGEDSDGNDIIADWKNSLSEDKGKGTNITRAIEELQAFTTSDMNAERYTSLKEKASVGVYDGMTDGEKLIAGSEFLPFKIQIDLDENGIITDEELANARESAKVLLQTYNAEIESDFSNVKTLANAYLMTNEDFKRLDEQSQSIASLLVNSIPATSDTAQVIMTKTTEEIGRYVNYFVQGLSSANPDVRNALINLFTLDTENISPDEMAGFVNSYISTIANYLHTDENELKVQLGFENIDELEAQYQRAIDYTEDKFDSYDPTDFFKNNSINTEEEIDKWLEIAKTATSAAEAERKYIQGSILGNRGSLSTIDILSQAEALSEGLNQLDKIYTDISDKEDFDWSSILNNDAFIQSFGEMGDSYDNFISTVSNSPDDINACQSAFNNLATAYIYNSGVLDNLTEETKDVAIAMLEQMGYTNAQKIVESSLAIVTDELNTAKEQLGISTSTLSDLTLNEIEQLLIEGNISEFAKNKLYELYLTQIDLNGNPIDATNSINQLLKMVDSSSAAGIALAELGNIMAKISQTQNFLETASGDTSLVEVTLQGLKNRAALIKEKALNAFKNSNIISANYTSTSAANSAKNNSTKSGSGTSNTGSGSSTPTETSQTFDWIETRLDVLAEKTSNLGDAFSNAYGIDAKNEAYLTYLSAIQEEIDANTTAIAYYEQRLNEIGLSYKWISKIQSGAFDISTITDQTLIDQIQQYQSFYEKIQGYQNTIQSLEQQRQKAQADHARDVVDTYDQEIESFQKIIDKQKAFVSLKELFGGSASKKDLETQQNAVSRQINRIEEQNRGLDQLIRTTTYGSEAWQIYRDKIEENKDSISDFTQSLAELAKEIANLPLDTLDAKLEKISQKKEKNDAKIANTTSAKEQNKLINQQMKLTKKENKQTKKAATKTKENLSLSIKNFSSAKQTDKKYVSADQQKKIDSYYAEIKTYTKSKKQIPPSLITKLSEEGHSNLAQACVNYNAALEANNTAQATAALTAETTKTKLAELAKEKFDNVQTEYERNQSQINSKANTVNSKMELASAKGYLESENWYEQLIAYEQQQQNSLQSEATALQNRLDKAIASGNIEKYSEEWWEMTEAIQSVNESLEQGELTLQEYQNQLEQIKANNFDFLQQQLSRLTSESDFFIDLMADKDLTDDNGLTDYGTATLGLHYQNYDTYLAQAEKYGEEIARINGQLANDPYNTTLLSQLQEREDAQRDCILAAEEEKNAVIDLKKQGYDALANSLSNVISKYKESLRSAKDAHDYQQNIAKQSENINSLQRKITAYTTLSGNEEIAAKLQQANKELAEAQESLEETMYDKYISDTEDILDDLLDELEAYIEELISNVDSEFTATRETVNQNADEIKSTLDGLSASYDISLSSAVKEIWKDGYTPEQGFTAILDKMDKLITASDAQADQQADQDTPQEPDTNQDAVFQEVLSDQDGTFSGAKSKEPLSEALTDRNPDLMSAAKSDQTSAISRHDKIVPSLAISEFSLATLEENLPPMSQLFNSTLPVYQDRTSHPNTLGGNVSISFGDLTLPDVTDSAEFAATVEKTMRNAICSNGKTTKCLTEAVASQMTGSGIGKANLYR